MMLECVVDEDAPDYDIAAAFIAWLENMGAQFRWRDGEHWCLDLDGVVGLTHPVAETLAREALSHRDKIRQVLRDRQRLTRGVIH